MSLLDLIKRPFERMGTNLENYMGGLLGEDVEGMSPEERRRLRQRAISAIAEGMGTMTPASVTLREAAGEEMARRQRIAQQGQQQQRMQEAQRASGQIAGRLMGGMPLPTAPGPMAGDELTGVNVQSAYRRDPQDALRMAMTPAGVDAMQINPFLQPALQEAIKPPAAPSPTDDMREYAVAVDQGYKGSFMDYMRDIKGASAQRIVLPSQVGETEYEKIGSKTRFESQDAAFKAAQQAQDNLAKIYETSAIIESGQPFTGALAETQLNIARIAQAVEGREDKRITDTEVLNALLGSDVFGMLSQLGIGARGLDTPAEREFLREVITGTISLNRDTLKKMTDIRANVMERAIDKFNSRVDRGELDSYFRVMGIQKQKFEKPEKPAATSFREGQRAVDQSGRVIVYRNGRWVDQQTGRPVQ